MRTKNKSIHLANSSSIRIMSTICYIGNATLCISITY